MVFHLRRHDFDLLTSQPIKLNDRVTFGHSLNMWPYTSYGAIEYENDAATS